MDSTSVTCEGTALTCPHCGRPSRKRYVPVDFLNAARAELSAMHADAADYTAMTESELTRLRLRVEQLETEKRSTS